ncbi:alginate export family protein [Cupriavidus necator]|uniref:Alginate export family protein n=1 Tax=Cupriavidus necator TaxID=106590 RepID=A0A1U9UZR7_CUPNE|nr:alginate export family protein [Cupriavidus necator]AQV98216.1 alginate export family protein [Cupriavidus necator]
MKKILRGPRAARRLPARPAFGLALAAASCSVLAQSLPAPAVATTAYKFLRYDEDYRYLQDPARGADPWDPVKYIPLGTHGVFLSLGGEIRERFEDYSAANFGVPGRTADSYLLHRILLHADLHAGDRLRGFIQLGNHLALGKDAAAPPYEDRLDLQQGFVDWHVPLSANALSDPNLRVGRQEMAFGSQRLVSVRDAPNVRRAFDGVRLGGTTSHVRIDAFATRPVLLKAGNFDDQPNHSQGFWGAYATFAQTFIPASGADLYYLGFENSRALYSIGSGVERRHSIGSRVFGGRGKWDWDWEALAQFGSFGQQAVRAWGASTDTGYTFDISGWKLRTSIKATAGSGDHDARDGKLGTYGGLFPKLAYFNQAGLLGASNVLDLQPSITLKPTAQLRLTISWDLIWRETTRDAVYTAAAVPIAGTAGRPGRYTGSQLAFDVFWQVDRHIAINAGLVRVDVARVLSALGAHNTIFTYVSAAYTF